MRNSVKVLRVARQMIESGWTQGAASRDALDRTPDECAEAGADFVPCKWCVIGAVYDAGGALLEDAFTFSRGIAGAFDAVGQAIRAHWAPPKGVVNMAQFNDTHTQADVLRMLDQASKIAAAREQAA